MTGSLKRSLILTSVSLIVASASSATDVTPQSLQANQKVTTQDGQLKINMDPQQALAPGSYTFELVVVDDSGNKSTPARTKVIVRDTNPPTAVLTAPQSVNVGQAIVLDGSKSADVGGKIVKYEWRLVN